VVGAEGLAADLVKLWAKRSGRKRVRVLPRRVAQVRQRLREGYTPNDLARAVAGVCYSPFHREHGHDTFEVAMRNGEQVEKGIRLWVRYAPIELVQEYGRRTGEDISIRAAELRAMGGQDALARRRQELEDERQAQAQQAQAQQDLDDELTAMCLGEMGGDDGDGQGT
jgi:hypothetical protein